jgi:hypothetical protein
VGICCYAKIAYFGFAAIGEATLKKWNVKGVEVTKKLPLA